MNGFAASLLVAVLAQVPPGDAPRSAVPEHTNVAPAAEEPPAGILTRAPELTHFVEAPFPPEAQAAGASGSVTLSIVIGEDGSVTAIRVLDPGPHPAFAPAAEAAVRQFRFRPAEIDGKPAPVEIEYRYEFVLKREAPTPPAEAPILLSGRVIERGTRTPVAGAAVEADGVSAETDAEGRFDLRGLPSGPVEVRVVSGEHEPLRLREVISPDKRIEVEYRLTRRHYDPYEAVVRGERPRKEVAVRTLEAEEVRTVAGTQGDVLKVVQNLPGVARSPFGIGLLVVRGSDPGDTGVFFDGVEVPILYHFGGITSVISSDFIEWADFYPGNFGARFGRASGGVEEIRSREPRPAFHGLAQVDIYDGRAQVEGPLAGGTAMVSVRRSWVDFVLRNALPRIDPEAADQLRIAPRYYDYQAKYSRPLAGGTLSVSAFGTDDKLEFVESGDQAGRPSFFLGTLFHRGAARWRRGFGDVQNDLVLSGGRDSFDILQGSDFGVLTEVWSLALRDTARWRLRDTLTLELGLDAVLRRFSYSLYLARPDEPGAVGSSGSGTSDSIVGEEATGAWLSPGAWIEAEWQPDPRYRVVAGLRFDSDTRLKTARAWLDPRLSLFWEPRPGTLLSAAAGLFGKAPEPAQLTATFGNEDLVPSRAAHYSLGLRQALPWRSSFEVTGFYKSMWRLPTPTLATDASGSPLHLSSEGLGRAYGLELFLKKNLSRGLFGWITYTWSRAERRDDPTQPTWPNWHLFPLDQTHNLILALSYRLPGEWIVGTRVRWVSGNPYTPYVAHVMDADTGRYQCIPSSDVLSRRVSPFFQADARVDRRWVFRSWMLSGYVDVQNVTNRTNAEFRVPSYDCTDQVVLPGLPLFPSLGLRAEW